MMEKERTYVAIDLKSFYASVECKERNRDPLTTNLVVADKSRTEKTICLAVSPALKCYGIPGRARLFEVVQKVKEANSARRWKAPNRTFSGSSDDSTELNSNPALEMDYIVAPPRMALYLEYSTRIYSIYLKYIAPEDIFPYSIDEVFMDVTDYLHTYNMTARELAMTMIQDVLKTTGITATAGIGTNMYLCNFCVSREELKTPYVMADELRIREVLLNIISNAVKFTKDGGTISFVAENCPGNDEHHVIVRYRISDTGIGMSEEFQSRIFDEFTQENDGARTSYKGTGLGMAIAKKYVDLMGGKIEVSSRQGIGSTFTVEIPLRIAEQVLTEKEEKLRKEMDLHGLHVLLAEDNDLNAEIAVSLLEEQGMIVTRAADGKSALLQFCNTAPGTFDLILMDVMMPEMNGYETTKAIRNLSDRPDGKEIPIVAMTANAFAEDVQAALDAGMDDHVAKPMDMDILISAIEKCVKR